MVWTKIDSGMYRSGIYEVTRLMNGSWNVAKNGVHLIPARTYSEAKLICEQDAKRGTRK